MHQISIMSKPHPFPKYKEGINPYENADFEAGREFAKNLQHRNFLLRDTGVTSYLFNQWKKFGLIDLPLSAEGRKWVTLNFGEYLWIKIINDLRKLGCPLEDIKRIKERYMKDSMQELLEKSNTDIFNQAFLDLAKKNSNLSDENFEVMKKELANINPMDLMREAFPRPLNLFESSILSMMTTGSEMYLLLFLTDYFPGFQLKNVPPVKEPKSDKRKKAARTTTMDFALITEEFKRMEGESNFEALLEVPHIKIPLRVYIRDFIANKKNEKHLEELGILSKDELMLLQEVRKKHVREITIKFKQDGNKEKSAIERIEITKEVKQDAEARLIETFTSKEYADISYKIENGKMVNFKKTIKIRPIVKE